MSVVKVYLNSKHRLIGSTAEAPEWELVKPVDFVNQFKVRQLIIPNVDYSFITALLYLNADWTPEMGGEFRLCRGRFDVTTKGY